MILNVLGRNIKNCVMTNCELFVVPPHRDNPAARRVCEKAGSVLITGKKGGHSMWAGHLLMSLTRERFTEIY